jgi:hypothetical protein
LDCVSNPGWASFKFSPVKIIFFSTSTIDPFDLYLYFSYPALSGEEPVCDFKNLKFNCAVFPKIFLKCEGSVSPGSSTNILLSPFWRILGSFVPSWSILFLTTSKDWLMASCLTCLTNSAVNWITNPSFSSL